MIHLPRVFQVAHKLFGGREQERPNVDSIVWEMVCYFSACGSLLC